MNEEQKVTAEETETKDVKAEKPKKEKKSASNDKIKELEAQLNEKNELLLRTAAEFDNYKKRTERERISTVEFTKANVLKTLLPVFDNVDIAKGFEEDSKEYAKGVAMIVKQLSDAITQLGITEIGAAGDAFDPNMHEAVMHIEDETLGENTVAEVLRKGYRIGDTVIRAAMVKVAN